MNGYDWFVWFVRIAWLAIETSYIYIYTPSCPKGLVTAIFRPFYLHDNRYFKSQSRLRFHILTRHRFRYQCKFLFSYLFLVILVVAGAASSPLCGLFTHKLSPNISRKRHSISPRASKDAKSLFNFKFPPMDKKPRWWWRTLAALPYLMPLHETWMYAETACHLHPFLDELEDLTTPFLSALGGLPSWFLIAYFIVAYLAVVRRKEWPHFFRFHVVTGMLLEITLQVTGTAWRWLPHAVYWGKVGMHFWTFFAFAFLFTVLECIRCCLAGIYADVPFVSEAAYIQIPFE